MRLVTEQAFISFKQGEPWGFGEIFKGCNDLIMAHAFALTQNIQNAEDLTMEAFIRLWEYRDSLKDSDGCYWYLKTIVTNKYYNIIKREKTVQKYQVLKSPDDIIGDSSNEKVERTERDLAIQSALQELPERTKKYTEMYLEGMKQRDIRKITGRSKSCVTSTLANGIRKMLKSKQLLECLN